MAMGKYSRVDGHKSSGYCSTVTKVVFVGFCLVGAWMLMSSSIVPVRDPELSSEDAVNEGKQKVVDIVSGNFEENKGDVQVDSTNGDGDHVPVEQSENRMVDNQEEKSAFDSDGETSESQINVNESQEENSVKESSDEKIESEEKSTVAKNDRGGNMEDGESKIESEDESTKGGQTNEIEQTDSKKSSDGNKSESGEAGQAEKEKVSQDQDNDNEDHGKDKESTEIPVGDQSEVLKETNAQNGAWSTQAIESKNEKQSQQSSISKDQHGHNWKVCNTTAGPDYIPCLDNWQVIRKLSDTMHYQHRERHCPEEAPTCVVPLPEGYKRSIKWPESRDRIWYYNVPYTRLAEVKGHQNWVKVTGEYLTFPGGGTQFRRGAPHYIDFIQKSRPDIAWGKRSRVILDVGCGVASFGGFLFEKDVIAMSFAPKDEHEAQVQFALERGIPAIISVMGTKRLPFPSSVFDLIHCARCRVPWHIEGGKLLLELNRVLRPGGYFVWSATPVYQKLPEDVGIWKAMTALTKSMCWDLKTIKKDRLNGVAAAIFRKPTSNSCYNKRAENEPPLCAKSDDAGAAWNVTLQACMHKVPVDASKRGSRWPVEWPQRLENPPYWLNTEVGVYGKAAPEDFNTDYQHWKNVVSNSYLSGMEIDWSSIRNVMDMRAVYGGFAAALKDLKLWVMNVVPIDSPDTLPIIYERGLFGLYHDWCQSFSTYPRSYDLLHADHLFSSIKKRCNLKTVIAEVDRILRPDGNMIVRDDAETIGEVEDLVKSLLWDVRMIYNKDGQGLLCVHKTYWRPKESETILSAMI